MNPALLECYTRHQVADIWHDLLSVFLKDEARSAHYPKRIIHKFRDFDNATTMESGGFLKSSVLRDHSAQIIAMLACQFVIEKSPRGPARHPSPIAGEADHVELGQALCDAYGPIEVEHMHVVVDEDEDPRIAGAFPYRHTWAYLYRQRCAKRRRSVRESADS